MKHLLLISSILLFLNSNAYAQCLNPQNIDLSILSPSIDSDPLTRTEVKNLNFLFKFLPAKTADEAANIWSNDKRINFLNNASINGTSETGSAYVDLISDYLGPVRVALSTTIVSSDKAEDGPNDNNIEKFLSGGGAAILNFTLIGPTLKATNSNAYLMTFINPKIGFDFPALGSPTNDQTTNFDLGLEFKFNLPLSSNKIGFTGNYRIGYVTGGEQFYSQIDLLGDQAKAFNYSQISIGITLPGVNWAILWNKTITGPESLSSFHNSGRISLVVSPE